MKSYCLHLFDINLNVQKYLFDDVLPMLLNTKVKDVSSWTIWLASKNHNSRFLLE